VNANAQKGRFFEPAPNFNVYGELVMEDEF
jgi:hypothetical protein